MENLEAMLWTAECYRNGDGVEADTEFAIYWYTRAMERDKVQAPFALGVIYSEDEIHHDKSKAVLYLQIAHENGHPEAERWLSYLSGTQTFDSEPQV